MSQLSEAVTATIAPVWAQASSELVPLIKQALDRTEEYSKALLSNPDMDVPTQSANVRQKRATELSNAIALYIQSKKPQEAEAISAAVLGFLKAHSMAVIVPGNMANQGGPVVGTGFVTKINYGD